MILLLLLLGSGAHRLCSNTDQARAFLGFSISLQRRVGQMLDVRLEKR